MRKQFSREQKVTILYGIMCVVLVIVILQLWLLVATMNAYLGGDDSAIIPAALVSLICLLLNLGLLWFIYSMERA